VGGKEHNIVGCLAHAAQNLQAAQNREKALETQLATVQAEVRAASTKVVLPLPSPPTPSLC